MVNYVTSSKPFPEVSEVMGKINEYMQWGNKKSLNDHEIHLFMRDQYNNCRRALEMASSLHEIDIMGPILYSGHWKKIKKWTKRIIRRMVAWYAHALTVQQNQFNVKTVETLLEQQRLMSLLIKENGKLKEKVNRVLEEILPGNSFGDQWHLEFADKFRGSKELTCERYKRYVSFFEGKRHVVDLGCGRGEFLELLTGHGIRCMGVDINREMLKEAKKKGLKVKEYDCVEYLGSLGNQSVDGIFAGQLLEHLSINKRQRLLELAYEKLSGGGVLVIETMNPLTLGIFCDSFYLDVTHSAPAHPLTLRFMAEQIGFRVEPPCFSDEFPEGCRFQITPDMGEGTKKAFERLNGLMFGAQKYHLVCVKGEKDA